MSADTDNKPTNATTIIQALDSLDASALTYVEIGLLQNALKNSATRLDEESKTRSENDESGDTVVIPAQEE